MAHQKKDILIVQGDWNAKVGLDTHNDWSTVYGKACNKTTNDRGLRLLEFVKYNNLVLANTLGKHKESRIRTWHSPNGIHHNQIDYIMVQQRFQSGVKTGSTRTYPGADIGSDHDLVMMNFQLRLKKLSKEQSTNIRFDIEKLKVPQTAQNFQAIIGGRFAPLLTQDEDVDTLTNEFSTCLLYTSPSPRD